MAGLPFDYALRNLGRRPMRTVLTGGSIALVAALLVATTAFVRGLSTTFSGAARSDVALLLSSAAQRDALRSAVTAGLASLVEASVPGVQRASDEIHMGTSIATGFAEDGVRPGLVRGVTPSAFEVHDALTLTDGRLPGPGEVLVGRLVAGQLGISDQHLPLGGALKFEGFEFEIVGHFAAPGTTLEGEIWTPLEPLRGLTQRADSSVVFVKLESPKDFARLDLFTKRRLDLELELVSSGAYYRELTDYFAPIRRMAWILAAMIGVAALFGGASTLQAAVQDRLSELATLRAVGYSGLALVGSLLQESLLLSAAGGLVGLLLARLLLAQTTVSLAMSAFALQLDSISILVGFGSALLLGLLGVIPAGLRLLRLPVSLALKED